MATSGLSNDTRNFHCVTVASVDVIKLPLRDILASHIQPKDLFQKIQSCSTLKLRQDQLKICFIPPPGVPDYNKFDVTLLYTLIRNLCSLPYPAQGWGNEPKPTDTQISDDIERLRLFRNNYYAHAESAVISDAVFKGVWKNLKLVFRRIQPKMGSSVDYEEELLNIEHTKCTDDYLTNFIAKLQKQTDCRDEPDFFIQGENEITCGSTAQFEADVNKVESTCWSITWQKRNGDVIKCINTDLDKEKYSGSTKRKLVIQSVCKEDEGVYQAYLSFESNGPEYKSRNTIRLHAIGEAPILNISEVISGSERITIHFNCRVLPRSPKVHHIEWRKNGLPLRNDTKKYVGGGVHDRHFAIMSPRYEDRGNYSCTVTNAVGFLSKKVLLDVPTVKLLEVSPVCCGSITTIKSVISSTPTPTKLDWQSSKDGVDFHSISETKEYKNANSYTSSSLVKHKTTFADMLFYRLLVWNGIGQSISKTIYLNVTGSLPNIKTIPETDVKKRLLKLISNVIIYDDSPEMQDFFWSRNNNQIDFKESGGKLSESRTDNPSLIITNVGPDDAGEYELTAINAVGSYTSEAIVLGAPRVSVEKTKDEIDGGQWINVTIKSVPAPYHVQWSTKRKEEDTFTPININDEEYKGSTVAFPHPVLFLRQRDQLENNCFRIEVKNFIGKTELDISGNDTKQRKIDFVENTIYNDDREIFKFTMLSSTIVNLFPPQKLDYLKFLIKSSRKVKNLTSLKAVKSVFECIEILQDEQLFTQKDVIYMQFLCKEAGCFDLFMKCKDYAEEQKALCYFKKELVNGYKEVEFHVQGDVSGYTKAYIHRVIKTVAVILNCKEEDIMLNGVRHSESFLLSLSVKVYFWKSLALKEKDRIKLRRLNIDYLIIDGEIIHLERSKVSILGTEYNVKDEFWCHLCDTTALSFHCDYCHIYLCKNCKNEHLSCASTEVPFELLKRTTKCREHPSKLFEIYCKKCKIPVCVRCVTFLEHIDHEMVDMRKTVVCVKQPALHDFLIDLRRSNYPNYQQMVSCTPPLSMDVLDVDVYEITRKISEMEQNTPEPNKLLDSNVSIDSAYKSRNDEIRRYSRKLAVSLPRFTRQKKVEEPIDQQCGSLSRFSIKTEHGCTIVFPNDESSSTKKPLIDEPRILTNINTGQVYGLHSVSCLIDEYLWTCSYKDDIMRLYNLQGELVELIQTKSGNRPGGIAVTRNGNLVYTDYNDRTVNIINAQIQTIITLQGWRPRGVCSTFFNDLLVTMTSDNNEQTKIVRYFGSIEKQTIQYDDKGTPLYSSGDFIKNISENSNLDICVADHVARAVVVVNQAGKLRFTYTGSPSTTEGSFSPFGITTDTQCRILVTDCNNHCIHILDQDGQFLRYIDNCHLQCPMSLCVDTRDNLFVTEFITGRVKKIQYCI